MDGLTIKPEELRSSSSEMKSRVNTMKEALQNASNIMTSTSDSFESSAAEALRSKYGELKGKFDLFYNEMISYADFLEKTAATYETADQDIARAADDNLES